MPPDQHTVPLPAMAALYDELVTWRRRGVAIELEGADRLRYRAPDGVDVDVLRHWLVANKPSLLVLLANLGAEHEREHDLLHAFLHTEFTLDAMLDLLVGRAADAWATSDAVSSEVEELASVAYYTVCEAIDLHSERVDARPLVDDLLWGFHLRRLVERTEPAWTVDLGVWLVAAYMAIAAEVHDWLDARHDVVLAEIERRAALWR